MRAIIPSLVPPAMNDPQKPSPKIRVGAVRYLNTKPLVHRLRAPHIELSYDYPSRLAEQLAASSLDIGLIPSVEFFLDPNYKILSDACIGCHGAVWSVKLFFRRPPQEVATLALDEGSRTSAALARILLAHKYEVRPELRPLPLGSDLRDCDADAILLIGDRAIRPPSIPCHDVWDLGAAWCEWTGLPFVFAMWVARKDFPADVLEADLTEARDAGLAELEEIAEIEAPRYGLTAKECYSYLHDNLYFHLGPQELAGLRRFYTLARDMELVPKGREHFYDDCKVTG